MWSGSESHSSESSDDGTEGELTEDLMDVRREWFWTEPYPQPLVAPYCLCFFTHFLCSNVLSAPSGGNFCEYRLIIRMCLCKWGQK